MAEYAAAQIAPAGISLDSQRCRKCGRLLGRMALSYGSVVEIKCERCETYNIIEVRQAVVSQRLRG